MLSAIPATLKAPHKIRKGVEAVACTAFVEGHSEMPAGIEACNRVNVRDYPPQVGIGDKTRKLLVNLRPGERLDNAVAAVHHIISEAPRKPAVMLQRLHDIHRR